LLIISFATLFYIHFQNYKQFKSYYFVLALIFGFIAIISWFINIITWELNPDPDLRILLENILSLSFSVYFYLFYRHFESIYGSIVQIHRRIRYNLINILLFVEIVFLVLHYLGFFPYRLVYDLVEQGFMPDYLQPYINSGSVSQFNYKITTYISHISQFIGCYVMILLANDILRFKLLKFQIISSLELSSIILIAISYTFILINNFLITSAILVQANYDYLIAPIFLFLVGMIVLTLNYVRTYPKHLLFPDSILDANEFHLYIEKAESLKNH
jgi:hypothetical protein